MDGAGAGGAAPERRKQLTAAEAVNHKRQLAQMVERELALTGADSVTDFDDALQMVLVETAFGRYPKHLLDVYTGKVVGRQERGDVVVPINADIDQEQPHAIHVPPSALVPWISAGRETERTQPVARPRPPPDRHAPQMQPFDAITSPVVKDVATGSGPHRKEHFFQFGSSRRH